MRQCKKSIAYRCAYVIFKGNLLHSEATKQIAYSMCLANYRQHRFVQNIFQITNQAVCVLIYITLISIMTWFHLLVRPILKGHMRNIACHLPTFECFKMFIMIKMFELL